MEKRTYGLFTAITMITGVVIGSGIFFKSDDILNYTEGNVLLGIVVFAVAAIAIIFGCLTISQLATRTDKPGGLITYTEEFVGIGTSCAFGWFQAFLYYPTITAVVSWVSGIYFCQLFGIRANLNNWTMIGVIFMTLLFVFNTISARFAGYFQNASMVIKLIPLLIITVVGLIFGKPVNNMTNDINNFGTIASTSMGWISAFAPIAYSFDGWIVSTSICNEIKNSKRNLPIALTVSPIIILFVYISYFVGMSSFLGPEVIMKNGDQSVYMASSILFGSIGGKVILIFVFLSVIGTVNGLTLGYIRIPYSMALRNMLPGSKLLSKKTDCLAGVPLYSSLLSYLITMGWMAVHYITQKYGMRGDVSEIAIGVSYLNYLVLYFAVIRLARRGEIKGIWKGYVIPVLAGVGSLVILSGSVSHPLFLYYLIICFLIMLAGFLYYRKNRSRIR